LDVVVLEEGGHHTRKDFHMREDEAFPMLYQDAGARTTKDLGITILQGRAVGGTTVVNWTTCFRTPEPVLDHWRRVHAISGLDPATLAPHFDAIERRLSVTQWSLEQSNRNNRLLYEGLRAIGLDAAPTRRNVKNCFQSGYCGMGCPVDAKQSMLVTYLPDAVKDGARVLARCRVERLQVERGLVVRADCVTLGGDGYAETGRRLSVVADRFILSAGAIGTPAILIRSGLSGGPVGRRTFFHPVAGVISRWRDPVEPFYGAPQSIASHALADRGDRAGVFFEAAPMHPVLTATALPGFGRTHADAMAALLHSSAHIVLVIDGFDPSEPGGTVTVRVSGQPLCDYPLGPRVWEAVREGVRTLVRADLAAGAQMVTTCHDPMVAITSQRELAGIDQLPHTTCRPALFSAHVMGGAAMGDDAARAVVRCEDLRHHAVRNLHVVDGSIFPTSLGVNPQETIYGIAHLYAERLARAWA
jgi:choline dehydrogenase-like flavoprotein